MRIKIIFLLLLACSAATVKSQEPPPSRVILPDDSLIHYVGRIDFSDRKHPRFWSPGVYFKIGFEGRLCVIKLHDEHLYNSYYNYIELVVDDEKPQRMKLSRADSRILVVPDRKSHTHTVTIYKNTESGIGYLQFDGIYANALFKLPAEPVRRIEFIGNSITCGMSSDLSEIPCGQGEWYDQHNAYASYGALTARALKAQFHLSSVSGIGLIHSCCGMSVTMPPVFDKINLRTDSIAWDFSRYQPDVVTVCLGQNDGIQDSAAFCSAYISFLHQLRSVYPKATLVCLSSPMADSVLLPVLKKYINSILNKEKRSGEKNVYAYFFSRRYHNGCGDHPDLKEHGLMAAELTAFIRKIKRW